MILSVWKNIYETPLACINRMKLLHPDLLDPVTYAGRLDPMAEGVLLLLSGDDVHKKDDYLHLDKEYEIDVVLGLVTDTGDLLGLPTTGTVPDEKNISETILSFIGTHEQSYPIFSSRTVAGKQLHEYGREGTHVELPSHLVTIQNIEIISHDQIAFADLADQAIRATENIIGDFRQSLIAGAWKNIQQEVLLPRYMLRVTCSSGTYMRQLAIDIGKRLNAVACTSRIVRTRVGKYKKVLDIL